MLPRPSGLGRGVVVPLSEHAEGLQHGHARDAAVIIDQADEVAEEGLLAAVAWRSALQHHRLRAAEHLPAVRRPGRNAYLTRGRRNGACRAVESQPNRALGDVDILRVVRMEVWEGVEGRSGQEVELHVEGCVGKVGWCEGGEGEGCVRLVGYGGGRAGVCSV